MKNNYLLYMTFIVLIGCGAVEKTFVPARDAAPLFGGEKTWNAQVDKNMKSLIKGVRTKSWT
jgi:hypothetical protein